MAPVKLTVEDQDMDAILDVTDRGHAPGRTGWTYHLIQPVCITSKGKAACVEFLNRLLTGTFPHPLSMFASDGLSLLKPNGSIRPVTVREAWLRLAALCALSQLSESSPSLAPLQNCVDVPGGTERVADS